MDLQFSPVEAAILFIDLMNLNIKPEQVRASNLRTESRIAGLRLAAFAMCTLPGEEALARSFEETSSVLIGEVNCRILGGEWARCTTGHSGATPLTANAFRREGQDG